MSDEEYRRIQSKLEYDKNSLTTGSTYTLVAVGIIIAFMIFGVIISQIG